MFKWKHECCFITVSLFFPSSLFSISHLWKVNATLKFESKWYCLFHGHLYFITGRIPLCMYTCIGINKGISTVNFGLNSSWRLLKFGDFFPASFEDSMAMPNAAVIVNFWVHFIVCTIYLLNSSNNLFEIWLQLMVKVS